MANGSAVRASPPTDSGPAVAPAAARAARRPRLPLSRFGHRLTGGQGRHWNAAIRHARGTGWARSSFAPMWTTRRTVGCSGGSAPRTSSSSSRVRLRLPGAVPEALAGSAGGGRRRSPGRPVDRTRDHGPDDQRQRGVRLSAASGGRRLVPVWRRPQHDRVDQVHDWVRGGRRVRSGRGVVSRRALRWVSSGPPAPRRPRQSRLAGQ